MPRGSHVAALNEFTAIHEHLPPEIERFVDKENAFRRLNDSPWRGSQKNFRHSLRQTIRVGFLTPMQPRGAFVVDALGCRFEWNGMLLIFREVSQISRRRIPNAR